MLWGLIWGDYFSFKISMNFFEEEEEELRKKSFARAAPEKEPPMQTALPFLPLSSHANPSGEKALSWGGGGYGHL